MRPPIPMDQRTALRQIHIKVGAEVITMVFEVRFIALIEGFEETVLVKNADRNEIAGSFQYRPTH